MSQDLATTKNEDLSLTGGSGQLVSSYDTSTREGKIKTLQANQDNVPLSDYVGKTLKITNIIMQRVDLVDDKTGELDEGIRSILIDDTGKAYSATSKGIVNALRQIMSIMGEPKQWDSPLSVEVQEKKSRTNSKHKFLTLVPVFDTK